MVGTSYCQAKGTSSFSTNFASFHNIFSLIAFNRLFVYFILVVPMTSLFYIAILPDMSYFSSSYDDALCLLFVCFWLYYFHVSKCMGGYLIHCCGEQRPWGHEQTLGSSRPAGVNLLPECKKCPCMNGYKNISCGMFIGLFRYFLHLYSWPSLGIPNEYYLLVSKLGNWSFHAN